MPLTAPRPTVYCARALSDAENVDLGNVIYICTKIKTDERLNPALLREVQCYCSGNLSEGCWKVGKHVSLGVTSCCCLCWIVQCQQRNLFGVATATLQFRVWHVFAPFLRMIQVFWDMTLCHWLCACRCFVGLRHLHLEGLWGPKWHIPQKQGSLVTPLWKCEISRVLHVVGEGRCPVCSWLHWCKHYVSVWILKKCKFILYMCLIDHVWPWG